LAIEQVGANISSVMSKLYGAELENQIYVEQKGE